MIVQWSLATVSIAGAVASGWKLFQVLDSLAGMPRRYRQYFAEDVEDWVLWAAYGAPIGFAWLAVFCLTPWAVDEPQRGQYSKRMRSIVAGWVAVIGTTISAWTLPISQPMEWVLLVGFWTFVGLAFTVVLTEVRAASRNANAS